MATYKHLRSSTANKRPTTSIADGQLAINTNTASPGLFFKDSAGTGIVKVGPVHVGTTAPNSSPAGSSGNYVGEQWLDTSVSPAQMKVWNGTVWVGIVADELPVSKLQDGAARQLIQTDAAGTGVEWTSNVDVPGTLDVTSTATFDSIAQHPLGTAGAPTITFTGDTNTGLYSPGADQVAISTNGSQRLLIDSTGQIEAAGLGSASAPAWSYVGDPNTGIFSPTADTLAITTGGSERLRVDSSGRLGLGTSSPRVKLHVVGGDVTPAIGFGTTNATLDIVSDTSGNEGANAAPGIAFRAPYAAALTDRITYAAIWSKKETNGTGAQEGAFVIGTNTNSATGVTEKFRITSSGRVGIGTTIPQQLLHVQASGGSGGQIQIGNASTGAASFDGLLIGYDGSNDVIFNNQEATQIKFNTNGGEAFRVDASRRLLVGTSSVTSNIVTMAIQGSPNSATDGPAFLMKKNTATPADGDSLGSIIWSDNTDNLAIAITGRRDGGTWSASSKPTRLTFSTTADGASSPTERMRITQDGQVLLGNTVFSATANMIGFANLESGATAAQAIFANAEAADASALLIVNRHVSDGRLVQFRQANTTEGTISVSGTTVTYGGGHLARWSQLLSDEDPSGILKGTIMSNLDEMCEWGKEDNEQLNKTKVSDVEGDPNVAGVFVSTSFDEDGPLDFFVAMTGDMIIRIAEGVTVQRGDLLMSAGDGTAKPQDDDIIRSKTVAKVTSTHVTCTYDDGSYCVPCVLMAC